MDDLLDDMAKMETVVKTSDGALPLPTELSKNPISPNNRVTKANSLVDAHYKLTAPEQKLVIMAASLIEPQDKAFKEYLIPVQDVINVLGINDHAFRQRLKQRIKAIFKKPLMITLPNGGDLVCTWFSSARIPTRKGFVAFCFDPQLKPYLIELKSRFTSYKLENVVQLGSSYSIRLYEILKGFENAPLQQRAIPISDLRGMLGIPPEKYKQYGGFKRIVIEPARKEIAEKTDIEFTYKERKLGRKITWLIFAVTKRKQVFVQAKPCEPETDMADITPPAIDPSLLEKIPQSYRDHHNTLKLVAAAAEQYGKGYVWRNLEYVANRNPGDYPAYLAHALKDDYGRKIGLQQQTLFAETETEPAETQDPSRPTDRNKRAKLRMQRMEQTSAKDRPEHLPQVRIIPGERVMYQGQEYVIEAGHCFALGNGTSLTEMQIRTKVSQGEITPAPKEGQ